MGWSGGNYTKGNNATGGWTGDASLGIGIEAGRHDTQDNDFATGIDQCLNKDGSNAATGNLNLGGFIPTNIGAGTAAAPALCAGGDVNTGIFSAAVDQIGIATNGTERVRIDASGKVGIGTTAPAQAFHVSDGTSSGDVRMVLGDATNNISIIRNGASDGWMRFAGVDGIVDVTGAKNLLMRTNGAERMRITSAGNVGIGGTPVGKFHTFSGLDDDTIYVETSNNRPTVRYLRSGTSYATTFVDGNGFTTGSNNSYACRAGASGGVYLAATATAWSAISDERFKKNIKPLGYGLNEVMQLNPVRFDYIDDSSEESARIGFIAQEVKPIIPEAIQGSEEIRLGLSITELIPALVKAIQELNAKVEALEAQLAATEVV